MVGGLAEDPFLSYRHFPMTSARQDGKAMTVSAFAIFYKSDPAGPIETLTKLELAYFRRQIHLHANLD